MRMLNCTDTDFIINYAYLVMYLHVAKEVVTTSLFDSLRKDILFFVRIFVHLRISVVNTLFRTCGAIIDLDIPWREKIMFPK